MRYLFFRSCFEFNVLIVSWVAPACHSNFSTQPLSQICSNNDNQAKEESKLHKFIRIVTTRDLIHPQACTRKQVMPGPKDKSPHQHHQVPFDTSQLFSVKSRCESVDNWYPPISHQERPQRAVVPPSSSHGHGLSWALPADQPRPTSCPFPCSQFSGCFSNFQS